MTESDPPPADLTKLTLSKQRWAREGRFLTGRASRPQTERLPPGQHLVKDWPVLDLGGRLLVGFKPDAYAAAFG